MKRVLIGCSVVGIVVVIIALIVMLALTATSGPPH